MTEETKLTKQFFDIVSGGHHGKVLGTFSKTFKKVEVECSQGHQFKISLLELNKGKWCDKCGEVMDIYKFLSDEMGIQYEKDIELGGFIYTAFLEEDGNDIIIDYDGPDVNRKHVIEKSSYAVDQGLKLIRINHNLLTNIENAEKYLTAALEDKDEIIIIPEDGYDWFDLDITTNVSDSPTIAPTTAVVAPSLPPSKIVPIIPKVERDSENVHTILTDWRIEKIGPKSFIKWNPSPHTEEYKGVAIGYSRVSTNLQREGISLLSQEDYIITRAKVKNLYVKAIYTDEGISGKDIKNRPAMCKLLAKMEHGGIQRHESLISYQLSRLGRETKDLIDIRDTIIGRGGMVLLSEVELEIGKHDAYTLYEVLASVSTRERKAIAERVLSNMQFLRTTSRDKKKPAFGWKNVGKGMALVVDEEEMQIVEEIRTMRAQKMSDPAIASQLNSMGYKNRKAKKFYDSRINSIRKIHNIP